METGELKPISFEHQFKNRKQLHFPEGKIVVVDVIPEVLTDKIPVLLVPGWSENPDTYRKTLAVGFNWGRRILTLGHKESEKILAEERPKEELRKAQLLLRMLEEKGIKKADIIAHSEGAINGLIAVMLKPEQFRNIVLDKPAGMIGQDTKTALTGRFVKLLLQEAVSRPFLPTDPTSSIRAITRTTRYIMNNLRRTVKEIGELSRADITQLITKLSDQGIKISVIAGVDDPLFPVNRQIANMNKLNPVLPIEEYYSVIGGHNELSINADQHAALAFNALNNLRDIGMRKSKEN